MYVDENACVKTTIDLKKKFKETDIDAVLYPYKKVLSDWREFYSKEEEYETRQTQKNCQNNLVRHTENIFNLKTKRLLLTWQKNLR